MLKLWTRNDATDPWGQAIVWTRNKPGEAIDWSCLLEHLRVQYPSAEFRVSETKPEE